MLKELVLTLFKPVAEIFKAREARKLAKETAAAKLKQASADQAHTLELNKDEYEAVATKALGETWKDEYVTVSVVSILNLVVAGGLAAAFGHPEVLQGVGIALTALGEQGVDMGLILEATIFAGIGLSVWKKF